MLPWHMLICESVIAKQCTDPVLHCSNLIHCVCRPMAFQKNTSRHFATKTPSRRAPLGTARHLWKFQWNPIRCGRPQFLARTSITQRVLEKLCTEKVCVDFLAPIEVRPPKVRLQGYGYNPFFALIALVLLSVVTSLTVL